MVIDHDGLHGSEEKSVSLAMEPGIYPIRIEYFEHTGEHTLSFEWKGPDTEGERTIVRGPVLGGSQGSIVEQVVGTISTRAPDWPTNPLRNQAQAEGAKVSQPSLAMGLEGLSDWSAQVPFINVMKTGRSWIGHESGQWGAWDTERLKKNFHLDENGWVKSIPSWVTAVESFILTDLPPEETSLSGRYRLTYEGEGKILLNGPGFSRITYRAGEIWFYFKPGEGGNAVSIVKTDPKRTGNYIRNIEIVKDDLIDAYEAGAIFNPVWIEKIKDLRSVRFMDWMVTNGSPVSTWEERPEPEHYSYTAAGAPVEMLVALANQIGADPWFNMPHRADDTYVRNFAEYVHTHLDPDLRAYVEYTNEMWNYLFPQTVWAQEQAQARWGEDIAPDAWMQFYGLRAAEVSEIWRDVYGAEAPERLRTVAGTHTGWPGLETSFLEAPLVVAEGKPKPVEAFDAYAVTGYFGAELGNERAGEVLNWLKASLKQAELQADKDGLSGAARDAYVEAHKYDLASEISAEAIRTGSMLDLIDFLEYHREITEANGLEMLMYEGGTHVLDYSNSEELVTFFTHFNYTQEMADLYEVLLTAWREGGGTLFNAFVDVSNPSQYGSWGALRHLDDSNPRWDVLAAFNRTVPAWWEERDADVFDDGIYLYGSNAQDRLEGTPEEDILVGRDGDDILVSAGGADKLNGGRGSDTAILPGNADQYSFARQGEKLIAAHPSGNISLVGIEQIAFSEEGAELVFVADLK